LTIKELRWQRAHSVGKAPIQLEKHPFSWRSAYLFDFRVTKKGIRDAPLLYQKKICYEKFFIKIFEKHPYSTHFLVTVREAPIMALAKKSPFRWQSTHSVGEAPIQLEKHPFLWRSTHLKGMGLWSVLRLLDLGPVTLLLSKMELAAPSSVL
jgi:hypothetical protein